MVLLNRNRLPTEGLRCRQIDEADIEAAASFLARGFPAHDRGFWLGRLRAVDKARAAAGFSEIRVYVGERSRRCGRDPAYLFDIAGGRRCHDPLQSFELVCRTALSP